MLAPGEHSWNSSYLASWKERIGALGKVRAPRRAAHSTLPQPCSSIESSSAGDNAPSLLLWRTRLGLAGTRLASCPALLRSFCSTQPRGVTAGAPSAVRASSSKVRLLLPLVPRQVVTCQESAQFAKDTKVMSESR